MEVLTDKRSCCGCHACYNGCPVQAITMQKDEEGFLYPVINEEKCIHCNKCKKVCPVLNVPDKNLMEDAYACYARDHDEQMSSSSGGVFAVLARSVLNYGGLVCGAAYDQEMQVEHILIESMEELSKIKGTKYVQSTIGPVYSKIKDVLGSKRTVLFSGTPCQVAGLKSYLGRDYDNLLCVDLICHGVPSPEVWKQYLQEVGRGQSVCYVNFREKREDGRTELVYKFQHGSTICEKKEESLYMKGFIQNLFLRPSCFECQFKGTKRCSDMTIGDFWSIKEFHPEFASIDGNSALIVHSEKAKMWLDQIKPFMNIEKATVEEVALWNECLLNPVKATSKRAEFYTNWKDDAIMVLIDKLTKDSCQKTNKSSSAKILSRIKGKIRRILDL